ncbi:astacin [Ancylostoma ceylanicum]|uniref:Metalloendopeptidase n=1 Tax=Ancylostoma ceylanicum TaxID=53326 RepID=A0A0D6M5E8_9BILA|nr:astacin [Ancylostoma ceylanicum]
MSGITMRSIHIIFLLLLHNSGAALTGITEKRSNRAPSSEVINYYFEHGFMWNAIEVEERGGRDCLYSGKPGELQSLSVDCGYFGGAAHEVGHALGLIHTHSRKDRDAYLIMEWDNIEKEYRENYKEYLENKRDSVVKELIERYKKEYGKKESDHHGVPYDYGSIMHYGTADKNPPMTPTNSNYKRTMGSQFISFTDLLEVNKRHDCLGKCPDDPKTATCEHQGFPNPKNCSVCVCPGGYGGRSCGDRSAPKKTIEVEIESISDDLKTYGCGYAAVEIKSQDDQRLTGYRFCSEDDKGILLKSNRTPVPIITYSMTTAPLHVTLKYRSVPTKG